MYSIARLVVSRGADHADSSASTAGQPAQRIAQLDALRGLAILAVTIYRFHVGPNDSTLAGQALEWVAHCGARGVDLFFVLSGFLITGILYDGKGTERQIRRFYVRRSLRIFPLYYITLLLFLVVLPRTLPQSGEWFASARDQQAWLWCYGTNLSLSWSGDWSSFGHLAHFWSLAIEEHFYLVWPLLVGWLSPVAIVRVCMLTIAISPIARALWLLSGGNDVAAEVFTLFRLDALAIGGVLALLMRGPLAERCLRWSQPAAWLLGPLLGVYVLLGRRLLSLPETIVAVFCGALVLRALAAHHTRRSSRLWDSPLLRSFGKYSYAMYVFQNPLIVILAPWLTVELLAAQLGCPLLLAKLLYIVLMTTIVYVVAWLSWHVCEKHFLRLRQTHDKDRASKVIGTDPSGELVQLQ